MVAAMQLPSEEFEVPITTTTRQYLCPMCDEWYDEDDYKSGKAFYVASPMHRDDECCSYTYLNAVGDEGDLRPYGLELEEIWWCGGGCFVHDHGAKPDDYADNETETEDVQLVSVWACGRCKTVYNSTDSTANEQAAIACCKED